MKNLLGKTTNKSMKISMKSFCTLLKNLKLKSKTFNYFFIFKYVWYIKQLYAQLHAESIAF